MKRYFVIGWGYLLVTQIDNKNSIHKFSKF